MLEPDVDTAPSQRRAIPWRRITAVVCWLMVGALLLFTFVRVFGLEGTWYVNTFMAFTPYVTVLSGLPLLLALVLRRWRAATVAILTSFALLSLFVPRAIGEPNPGTGPKLRVMSTNMKIGAASPTTIVALVRTHNIDLLGVEEFTGAAEQALQNAGLTALLPFSALSPIPGATGSAIYSRYPLSTVGYRPLAGGFGQEFATVTVPGAKPLVFEAVHSRAPGAPSTNSDWERSLAQEPAATPHGAVRLLSGDFNATLDHARLRTLLDSGYVDAASQLGDGLTPTWPYDGRPIPPVTLDHMFVDPRIGVASFGVSNVPRTDHRAIFAELTLPAA
jgi:endonuclease/exonuclease/phosphatase (EEP) superfamily protein YafD